LERLGVVSEILGEVKAKSFTLCDDAGNTRARLAMRGDTTQFSICDADGSERVSLSVDGAGNPSLLLADAAGSPRIELEYTAESDSARMTFVDNAGRVRMEMLSQGDDHTINLIDRNQTIRTLISEDNILLKPNGRVRLVRNEEVHK
jgi:hypothetical protein